MYPDGAWLHIPLYDKLTDRVADEQVYHDHDATDPLTALAIYSNPNFAQVVIESVEEFIDSDKDFINPECNTGCHRASVVAHTVTDVLNALDEGPGCRAFNAQLFPLTPYTSRRSICNQIDHAMEWADRQNAREMAGYGTDRTMKFAYGVVSQREVAEQNFNAIWDWVDNYNANQNTEIDVEYVADDEVVPTPSVAPRQSPSAAPRTRSRSPFRPSAKTLSLRPRQPESAPPCSSTAGTQEQQQEQKQEGDLRPPWAQISLETDVAEAWYAALCDAGVDWAAQKGLFGLAQSSAENRQKAFGIMGKLWKKMSDGEGLGNPSGFVWACVKRTWDDQNWG